MKNYDVLVVGELNVDLILNKIDSFPALGQEILANEMMLTLGSSSAIFASNMCVLGNRVAFAGKTGKDLFGDFVIECLADKTVDTTYIIRDPQIATGATIALNINEERAAVTYQGAMTEFTLSDIPDELLSQSRHLHFSSVFLQPGIQADVVSLFQKARALGLTTSFDPQWDPHNLWKLDLDALLPHVDIFLPNEPELLKLTRMESIDDAMEVLRPFPCISVVKQGKKGSTLLKNGHLLFQPAFVNNQVVDCIGAGDSLAAGFVHEYLKDSPLEVCQNIGNLMGALSTTAQGGTTAFKNREQVLDLSLNKFGFYYDS
jgi:sugar/nucleoside kinase (ribokinase family)